MVKAGVAGTILLLKELFASNMEKQFWKHFAAAIAALSASATLLTVLFNFDCLKSNFLYGLLGAVIVMGGSIGYAFWQIKSKKSISVTLSSELKLTISEGNLFEKKGVICIPVNEYFDTHVGDGVIAEKSVHGQFINRLFKDRINEITDKIDKGLPKGLGNEHKRRISGCPQMKYPLGTCVDIRDGENLYVLFALCHFDDNDKAYVKRVEYSSVVNQLMDHLTKIAEDKAVYMPLFGAGLARLRRTPQRILLNLVDTLDFNDSSVIPGGIHIVIKSLSNVDVNLTSLEHIVKKGITEAE